MNYGLIGEKLEHSISPQLHGLFADYEYELHPLPPEALESFLLARDFRGLNVTIPYKQSVIPYCDRLTARARAIGSVNTLSFDENGQLIGDNTDYDGFLTLADHSGIDFKDKKVLIMGSGGTSLTARAAVKDRKASEIVVVSRKGPLTYEKIKQFSQAQIIINTTPVGMYPKSGRQLIDLNDFPQCEGVLDVVYNPLRTRLILQAQDRGLKCAGGLLMLCGQARRAAEIFSGKEISDEALSQAFRQMEKERTNIIMIGMPGCGKTTIGRLLAQKTGREFADTDEIITSRVGSIKRIFAEQGESTFRRIETEVIAEISAKAGVVISVGGGAPIQEANRLSLRQNGRLFFLQRPLDQLELANGRPLSQTPKQLQTLYNRRMPVYLSCCDFSVSNAGTPEQTIHAILKELQK